MPGEPGAARVGGRRRPRRRTPHRASTCTPRRLPDGKRPTAAPHTAAAVSFTRLDLKYSPYLYVLPFFVIFAVFSAVPDRVYGLDRPDRPVAAEPTISFVGLDNFVKLLTDDRSSGTRSYNTFGMFVLSTVPQLLLALMLANALNRKLAGQTVLSADVPS